MFDVRSQDESWFVSEVTQIVINRSLSNIPTFLLLHQVKSELALATIFESVDLGIHLLTTCIERSGHKLIQSFDADCIQFTPHLNYLKIPTLLNVALAAVNSLFQIYPEVLQHENHSILTLMISPVTVKLNLLNDLDAVALRHIDAQALEDFISRSFLDASILDVYLQFAGACLQRTRFLIETSTSKIVQGHQILDLLQCADLILRQKSLWLELNRNGADYAQLIENMLDAVCKVIRAQNVQRDYEVLASGTEQRWFGKPADELELKYRQAIYVAQFVMENIAMGDLNGEPSMLVVSKHR